MVDIFVLAPLLISAVTLGEVGQLIVLAAELISAIFSFLVMSVIIASYFE